jgi:hypothetical protein
VSYHGLKKDATTAADKRPAAIKIRKWIEMNLIEMRAEHPQDTVQSRSFVETVMKPSSSIME